MKILLTGGQGFIGSALGPALERRGHQVAAPVFDLFEPSSVEATLAAGPFDAVVHLAGLSHAPTCEAEPERAYRTNLGATALLLDLLNRKSPGAHLVFPSTGHVYRAPEGVEIEEGVVLGEDRPIAPGSVYARSKWAAELVLRDAALRLGARVTILRLFNHTHRSQPASFFLPHIHQSLLAHQGSGPAVIPVGNLEVQRDIGALQDLLAAFAAVLEAPPTPAPLAIYNVSSGTPKHLGHLARALAERLGVPLELEIDSRRVRPGEPRLVVGSSQRLTEATGWAPAARTEASLIDAFLAELP